VPLILNFYSLYLRGVLLSFTSTYCGQYQVFTQNFYRSWKWFPSARRHEPNLIRWSQEVKDLLMTQRTLNPACFPFFHLVYSASIIAIYFTIYNMPHRYISHGFKLGERRGHIPLLINPWPKTLPEHLTELYELLQYLADEGNKLSCTQTGDENGVRIWHTCPGSH
jgi:hypothetical protein